MSSLSTDRTAVDSREELYDAMNDETLSLYQKQERALEIGRDVLGVENGHIERVRDDDHHEITVSVGDATDVIPQGDVVETATRYCRRTVQQDSPIALSDAPNQGWTDDPAYAEHGLDCYLGTILFVDGETYGTVCFVSREPRPEEFSATEKMFIELLARLLGREIESHNLNEQLTAHQQARKNSRARYEALMNAAPAALFVAEADTGTTVEVNDRATDLVGYSREELVGMAQSHLHAPNQREQYQAEVDRFFETDGTISQFSDGTPLRFQHKDGTIIPVEITTSLVDLDGTQYVMGLVQDISDRRERREELRVKNRAMDEAAVGITIADAQAGDLPLIYANQAFESLTGYESKTALGRNCRFLQGPETDPETLAEIRDAVHSHEPVTTELVNYRADGSPFWNQLTITPVENSAGDLTHFVGIQQDVTQRKRRTRLLGLLNRVLRHNLRNEMNTVMGYADVLADQHDGETAEYLDRINQTAQEMVEVGEKARTIQQTLQDPGEVQARELDTLLETVASGLREEYAPAKVTVQSTGTPMVMATDQFEDALYELGANALEHGGLSPEVTFTVAPGRGVEGCIGIVVQDDGPGLPETEQRVLETGNETVLEHGDSIGLWMVHWITTGLGGTVTTDVDETGTTVTLQVPADTPESDRSVSSGERSAAASVNPSD
jgi:PAS domain S-box-containing protein